MTALADLAERINDQSRVVCTFHCERPVLLKDPQVATHLYRIAQEATTNALLHGRARTIHIRLVDADGSLTLSIEDDGVGLASRPRETLGSGLRIMQYRARLINAVLDIKSGRRALAVGETAQSPKPNAEARPGTLVTCTLKPGHNHDQERTA